MPFKCALCAGEQAKVLSNLDSKSKLPLRVSACLACGLVQQEDLPSSEELAIYYSHNYREDYKRTYFPKLKHVRRAGLTATNRLAFIRRFVSPSPTNRLLDIGAGGGEFVYMATKAGFSAQGLEPNHGYSEFAKSEYGVDIRCEMFSQVADKSYELVTISHVLEHMAKPVNVARKISEILTNGGHLFIEVPNILQKDASPHNIFFKAHLFYYSRFTLEFVMSKHFDLINIEDDGNLLAMFRKKTSTALSLSPPGTKALETQLERLEQRGWSEYLVEGGGLIKPLRRIRQIIEEAKIKNRQPKQLLDEIWDTQRR